MFGYCGVDLDLELRPRLGGDDLLGGAPSSATWASSSSSSKSRTIERERRPSGVAADLVGVDEALAPGGGLGRERVGGERGEDAGGKPRGVDELPVAKPGWMSTPCDGHGHLDRAERLVLELAELGAVERVGAVGAEALDVEQRRPLRRSPRRA